MPGANGPRGHVFGHDRSCAYDRAFADGDSGMNKAFRRDPDLISHGNRLGE
jgi:hypothetical protein